MSGCGEAGRAQTRPSPTADAAGGIEPAESYQAFPVDALPAVAARLVRDGAAAIGCDPSYIALPLLAAAAAAVGNTRQIRLKRSWAEPAVLWCAVVGDSGTLKSPAFDLAIRATRQRQARAMDDHRRAMAEHADAADRFAVELKAWRRADPAARGERPAEPTPPPCERLWCSDTTVEALADRLAGSPRGLLVARDELSGWLASFNQYKAGQGGDVANWLEMHRAGAMMIERKTGDRRNTWVPRAAVCVAGGIQPQTLRRCLTAEHMDNGMAARLLLAMPPRLPKQWTEADVDPATVRAFELLVDGLLELLPSTGLRDEPEPADVGLTAAAKSLWVRFYNRHAAEQATLSGELAAAWSKLEGYAARLALVVHCCRQAAGEAVDPWKADADSLAAGITLAEWFGREARRVYALLAEGADDRTRRQVVELVAARGGRATIRDLMRGGSRLFGSADEWQKVLNRLAAAGVGRWQQANAGTATGGRPSRVFELTAAAAGDTTPPDAPAPPSRGRK